MLEDDGATRRGLAMLLGQAGYEVVAAGSAAAAISALGTFRPDLLLTDWSLGGERTASSAIRATLEAAPRARIIVYTGQPLDDVRCALREHRVRAVAVSKPAGFRTLLDVIERRRRGVPIGGGGGSRDASA